MDKRVSLSRSFSSQFGVGSKGEKPTAAGASESKSEQKKMVDNKGNISFLCLSSPLSEVAKTLSLGRKDAVRVDGADQGVSVFLCKKVEH